MPCCRPKNPRPSAAQIALLLVGLTTAVALTFPTAPSANEPLPGTNDLGLTFLGVSRNDTPQKLAYLLPFEIVSVHLLVVLIAAAYLARAKKKAGGP